MNLRQLAQEIAKREGGKSQVKIGDIREVIKILADIIYEDATNNEYQKSLAFKLFVSAEKRAKRGKK
jgi:hypothetical protein